MGVPPGSVLGPVLYLTYTIPISKVIKKYRLDNHIYTGDTQFMRLSKMMTLFRLLTGFLTVFLTFAYGWRKTNLIKLNEGKLTYYEIILGDRQLTMARTVTNLGIIFDQEISFSDLKNQLCRTSFSFLKNCSKFVNT